MCTYFIIIIIIIIIIITAAAALGTSDAHIWGIFFIVVLNL
jgi:hypothetical protein